jgi:hypothetical protein
MHFKKPVYLGLTMLLGLLGVTAVFAQPADPAATFVRCDPAVKVALVGEDFTIDLYAENVLDMRGFDARYTYDPALVEPLDGLPDEPGLNLEPLDTFFVAGFKLRNGFNLIDGGGKNVPIWYATLGQSVDGSGPVARIHFRPLGTGSFTMDGLYSAMTSFGGGIIEHEQLDCRVEIVDPAEGKVLYAPVISAP